MSRSVVERIRRFNKGREPERLALKYAAMRHDPFAFFRGTAHLFYADWPSRSGLDRTPLTWACGDLHLENFGCYKGANGLAYFDINDFDEATLAPAARDLTRFATSTLLAARVIGLPSAEGRLLCSQAHLAYSHALSIGKPMWIERATAKGMVKQLLKGVKRRTRAELLRERTEIVHGRRRLRIDRRHALPATHEMRAIVTRALGASHVGRAAPRFFRVLDVARRIAGTGSLGVRRFIVLVHGHAGKNGNVLIDLKQAAPSALLPTVSAHQPRWFSNADRVVSIQHRVQAVSPALLHATRVGSVSYILRELQPLEDRLALADARNDRDRLAGALRVMAQVVAWGQLRSSGQQGSAITDEWIAFGRNRSWVRPVLDYARQYADIVRSDWKEFVQAYDDGGLGTRD